MKKDKKVEKEKEREGIFEILTPSTFPERVVEEVASGEAWQEVFNASGWHEKMWERLQQFEEKVVTAVGDQLYDQGPDEQRERWNVIGSLFYCVTVITTIGTLLGYTIFRCILLIFNVLRV